MDWKKAINYLEEVAKNYIEIGAAGQPALMITIFPLRTRYEKGERTEDLYNSIMELE